MRFCLIVRVVSLSNFFSLSSLKSDPIYLLSHVFVRLSTSFPEKIAVLIELPDIRPILPLGKYEMTSSPISQKTFLTQLEDFVLCPARSILATTRSFNKNNEAG